MRIATPDLVTNSYFPALAAEELGVFREEGLDAHVELLPSLDAVTALRDGAVDFVAGGAHTTLLAFPQWRGAKLLVTRCRALGSKRALDPLQRPLGAVERKIEFAVGHREKRTESAGGRP